MKKVKHLYKLLFIILFGFILNSGFGQGIGLYQIERAAGADSIVITLSTGEQVYADVDTLMYMLNLSNYGYFTVSADTNTQSITHQMDTTYITHFQTSIAGNVISGDYTDNQTITDLSLSGDTLSITIESGNTSTVVLSGVSTQPVLEEQTINTNTMTLVMSWPADQAKYEVWINDNIRMDEVVTVTHISQYSRSGQVLTFFENLENEKVSIRVID